MEKQKSRLPKFIGGVVAAILVVTLVSSSQGDNLKASVSEDDSVSENSIFHKAYTELKMRKKQFSKQAVFYLPTDRAEGCYFDSLYDSQSSSSSYPSKNNRIFCKDGSCEYQKDGSGYYYSKYSDNWTSKHQIGGLYVTYQYQDFTTNTETTWLKMPFYILNNQCQNEDGRYNFRQREDVINPAYSVRWLIANHGSDLNNECYYESTEESDEYAFYEDGRVTFSSGEYCEVNNNIKSCYSAEGMKTYNEYGLAATSTDLGKFDWDSCSSYEEAYEDEYDEDEYDEDEYDDEYDDEDEEEEYEEEDEDEEEYEDEDEDEEEYEEEDEDEEEYEEEDEDEEEYEEEDEDEEEYEEEDEDEDEEEYEEEDEDETTTGSEPIAGFEYVVITAPFIDTDESTLKGEAAAYGYSIGLWGGYPDGTFGGNNYVLRAEAAKFLMTAKHDSVDNIPDVEANDNLGIGDVLAGQWYVKFLKQSIVDGVMTGDSNTGLFRPADTVNRAEWLKMLTLATNLKLDLEHSFSDVSDEWFAKYAGIVPAYNLFPEEKDSSSLNPEALITRYEAAVSIYKILTYEE